MPTSPNNAARKAMYKKRKMELIKMVSELRTLCNVDAFAIIYSPDDAQTEVCPSPLEAMRDLAKFKNMSTEKKQIKKMRDRESFLWQRIAKVKEELEKQRNENREKITQLMFTCLAAPNIMQDLSLSNLNDLSLLIVHYLKDIDQRMNKISVGPEQEEDCKPPIVT